MHMTNAEIIAEVTDVERRWVQAHRDLDIDVIDEIRAPDYLQIRADGTVIGKVEVLESYRSGKRHWDFAESDEYQIVVHGDTAILVGRWRGRGENDGEQFDYTARFMAIYARLDGVWRLVADQSTPLT
jgi:ketosteroid isomerase-like protein